MLVLVTLLSLTGVVLAVMSRSHEGAVRLGQLAQDGDTFLPARETSY